MGHENAEGMDYVGVRLTDGMDSPVCSGRKMRSLVFIGMGIRSSNERSPPWMLVPLLLTWPRVFSR